MRRGSAARLVMALILGWEPLAIAQPSHLGVDAAPATPQMGMQSSPVDGPIPHNVHAYSGSVTLLKRNNLDERGNRAYEAAAARSRSERAEGARSAEFEQQVLK